MTHQPRTLGTPENVFILHRGVRPIDPARLAVITRDAGMCEHFETPVARAPQRLTGKSPRSSASPLNLRDLLAARRRERVVDGLINAALGAVPLVVMAVVGFWLASGRS